MQIQSRTFSRTINIPEDEIKIPESFRDLFLGIGSQITESSTHEEIERSTVRVCDLLKSKRDTFGTLDILDLMPDKRLSEFISGLKEARSVGQPAPLVKLYLHFGQSESGKNYGVQAFLLPPTCETPPHNHRGNADKDTCMSIIVGSAPVLDNLCTSLENGHFAYLISSTFRNKGDDVAVIRSDQNLGIGDTHQLSSPYNSRQTDETIMALEDYQDSRRSFIEPSKETSETLDRLLTTSLHPYLGLDQDKIRSSVKTCFGAIVKMPKDLRRTSEDILHGEEVWNIEKALLENSMIRFELDTARSDQVFGEKNIAY